MQLFSLLKMDRSPVVVESGNTKNGWKATQKIKVVETKNGAIQGELYNW
jgi:hypothetical protein